MNGKENIIAKILSDADVTCSETLSAANKQAHLIAEQTQTAIDNDKRALSVRIEALSAERARNRLATAELDARKYKLNAKQQLISDCYNTAYEKLVKMSVKEKETLLKKLLATYAEQGETVCVCKADKEVVTQKFLDSLDKGLILGKSAVDADGGVVLQGKGYEKDLTLKSVLSFVREQTEGKVADALFGE